MRLPQKLPTPETVALTHSQRLLERMRQQMAIAQQPHTEPALSFHDYMQMALYEPGLGYYVAGSRKLGAAGDFVTAPEISPLFSRCLARYCRHYLQTLGQTCLLELGAGSGRMAAELLQELERLDCLPERYYILDLSPELRERQQQTLQQQVPQLLSRVQWLERLPSQAFDGVILANEVLDAMPVERFCIDTDTQLIRQQTVVWRENSLHWADQPAPPSLQPLIQQQCLSSWNEDWAGYRPSVPYCSELNTSLPGWLSSLAQVLNQGLILLMDYGYERRDYYHPQRTQGTLLCHYRHRVHDNPLLWPGLQDITASVNFTAVAEAALQAGLEVSAYTTQADFLFQNDLETLFNQTLEQQPQHLPALAQQVRLLTLPSEMGERFKVMSLTKGFTSPPPALTLAPVAANDRRYRL